MSTQRVTIRVTEEEVKLLIEMARIYLFSFKQRPVKTEEGARVSQFATELLGLLGASPRRERGSVKKKTQK